MNHFSYPLTIVQINISENPKISFPNQNPRPQTIEPPPPRIFNHIVPPWGSEIAPQLGDSTQSKIGQNIIFLVLAY